MTVFVVLALEYGDQGVGFHGVFSTREKAQVYINSQRTEYWDIEEVIVDGEGGVQYAI